MKKYFVKDKQFDTLESALMFCYIWARTFKETPPEVLDEQGKSILW